MTKRLACRCRPRKLASGAEVLYSGRTLPTPGTLAIAPALRLPRAQGSRSTVKTGLPHRFVANKEAPTMRRHTSTALLALLELGGVRGNRSRDGFGAGQCGEVRRQRRRGQEGHDHAKRFRRTPRKRSPRRASILPAQNKIAVSVFILSPSGQIVARPSHGRAESHQRGDGVVEGGDRLSRRTARRMRRPIATRTISPASSRASSSTPTGCPAGCRSSWITC